MTDVDVDTATVRLERTYDAPAEAVFDAWTNPEVLRRWWGAGPDWTTPVADVDLRVGGSYRLSMQSPDSGDLLTVYGEYREIERPARLVYSWAWVGTGPYAGHESVVAVDFRADGDRTTVVIEHSGLLDEQSRAAHTRGWNAALDNFGLRIFARSA
jgi:uncharacterized protein YndB with AHSA1/START domain